MLSPRARQVLDHFQRILQADGGALEWLETRDGVMRLAYRPGHNPECESCVLSPEDLRELVAEAVKQGDPAIRDVDIVIATSQS